MVVSRRGVDERRLSQGTSSGKERRRASGALLAIVALPAWLTDRFTHAISDGLGKTVCGDRYLQAVNGTVGDASCGFNTDLYLTVFLMLALVAGALLYLTGKRKS